MTQSTQRPQRPTKLWKQWTKKPCTRTSWCILAESRDPSSKGAGATASIVAKTEEQSRSRDGDESNWRDAESWRPTKITDVRELLRAPERLEDEIRKHEENTGAAMLNEATKKAIATDMAPPELATHLKLNAHRYNTYAQMK